MAATFRGSRFHRQVPASQREGTTIKRRTPPGTILVRLLFDPLLLLTLPLALLPALMLPFARMAGRRGRRETAPAPIPNGVRTVGLLGRAALAGLAPTPPPAAAIRRGPRSAWQRAGGVVLAASCFLFAGTSLYAWQVTTALRDAERAIVVPLPDDGARATASGLLTGAEVPVGVRPEPSNPGPQAPPAATPPAEVASGASAPPAPAPPPAEEPRRTEPSLGAIVGAATRGDDPGRDPIWRGKRYLNVLVLGFDSREGETRPPRSDVFMIAQLDLFDKRVNIVSVPRDLWLTVPGYGEERINAAYPLGWRADQPAAGVALARRTIEQNFGLTIDYYISVDFRGFQGVVDAVGGIDIVVPYYLRDDEYPTEDYGIERIEFRAGPQHLDGKTALKYVRTRHQDTDYGRRRRQEQVLVALFDKAKSVEIVPRLPIVLRSFAGTVQTNFTFEEQLALGRVALAMPRTNIGTYSIDETMTGGWVTPGGAEVVRGDWPQIRALIDRTFVRPGTVREP